MNDSAPEEEWQPAFEGQRPPFQPGHELSLRHGYYSPRRRDPLAADLVERVLSDNATAYLRAAHWRPALWAWAKAEAQVQLLEEWLAKQAEGAGNGVGNLADESVRAAYLLHHRASARAMSGRTRLGLDPLSAARLGRDRAATQVDVARVMADLERAERERQQHEEDGDG